MCFFGIIITLVSKMENIKNKIEKNVKLRNYLDLINKIAKVEYKSVSSQHLIEFDELVNIGIQTVDVLCSDEKKDLYNESYLSTAIKWAIRNELRRRYRWHGVKHNQKDIPTGKYLRALEHANECGLLQPGGQAKKDHPVYQYQRHLYEQCGSLRRRPDLPGDEIQGEITLPDRESESGNALRQMVRGTERSGYLDAQ